MPKLGRLVTAHANNGSRSFDRDHACGARIGVAYIARMPSAPRRGNSPYGEYPAATES
jgi:hypothetical protein